MRDRTIDVTKGIGILLVVVGHSRLAPEGSDLHRVIFSFHMPLFFVLSGVFLRSRDGLLAASRIRATGLLWPYLVVSAAVGLVRLPRMLGSSDWPETGVQFVAGVAYGTGPTIPWAPLWFLPHLFLASLCALILIKAVRDPWREIVLAAVLFVMGVGLLRTGVVPTKGFPWSADLLPATVALVVVGHALQPVIRGGSLGRSALFLVVIVFVSLHVGFDPGFDLNRRQIGAPVVVASAATLGILLCLGLASMVVSTRTGTALSYLGARTMPILLFHWYLLSAVFTLLVERGGGATGSAVVSVVAACLLPLALRAMANRATGWLKAWRYGGSRTPVAPADGGKKNCHELAFFACATA